MSRSSLERAERQANEPMSLSGRIIDGFAHILNMHTDESMKEEINQLYANINGIINKSENLRYFPPELKSAFMEVAPLLVDKSSTHREEAEYVNLRSVSKDTSTNRLKDINKKLIYMKDALDDWHHISKASNLLKSSSEESDLRIEEQRKQAEESFKEILESYKNKKDTKEVTDQEKHFKEITEWFKRPVIRWKQEVSAILTVLKESNTRTTVIANQEATKEQSLAFMKSEGEETVRHMRHEARGKFTNIIESAEGLQKLVPENYEELETLRTNSIDLLNIEWEMLKKAGVEGANKQGEQWKEIRTLLEKYATDKTVSPDDRVECHTEYIEGYSKCLALLHKAHMDKKENRALDAEIKRIQAENYTQEMYLKLEMANLKKENLSAFNNIKSVKEQGRKTFESLNNQFERRVSNPFNDRSNEALTAAEENSSSPGYLRLKGEIIDRWEMSNHQAYSAFLNHMQEAVKGDTTQSLTSAMENIEQGQSGLLEALSSRVSSEGMLFEIIKYVTTRV